MIYLFINIQLMIILLIGYISFGKSLLSPTVIAVSIFIISVFVAGINAKEWTVDISFLTAETIVSGIIAIAAGEAAGRRLVLFNSNTNQANNKCIYNISIIKTTIVSLFMIVIDYRYFKYIYRLSLLAGNNSGYRQMIAYARHAIINPNLSIGMSTLLSHSLVIVDCLGIVYLALIIWEFAGKRSVSLHYFIPCSLYLLRIGLSTARIGYIRIVLFALMFYFFSKGQLEDGGDRLGFNSLLLVISAVVLVYAGFRLLGNLTGKSNVRELWSDLSNYTGSSIVAFDIYLNNPPLKNEFFGKETLYNLYSTLRALGLTKIETYSSTLPFVRYGLAKGTNIYTAFRRLIQDYGYSGMYVLLFLESFLYQEWLTLSKSHGTIDAGSILCVYHIYMLALSSIDEQFISTVLSMRFIYIIIYMCVIWKVLVTCNYDDSQATIEDCERL